MVDVIIVGGGISGLSLGFFLKKRGIPFMLVEKEERVGGVISSGKRDGFVIDYGPNSLLLTNPSIREVISGVGLEARLQYANKIARNRYILKGGRLRKLPINPVNFLFSSLFSIEAKLKVLKEPWVRKGMADVDESLSDFVLRRLGREFLDYAINPFVAGVTAGTPEILSVRSAFPRIHDLEQKYGSLIKGAIKGRSKRRKDAEIGFIAKDRAELISFPDGLQELPNAIGSYLEESIFLNSRIEEIRKVNNGVFRVFILSREGQIEANARVVAFACAAEVLQEHFQDETLSGIKKIPMPPLVVIFLGYKSLQIKRKYHGYGFLVPEKERSNILGAIFGSVIFPQRAETQGAGITVFMGGMRRMDVLENSDETLIREAREDLRCFVEIYEEPSLVEIRRYETSIPQYIVGHNRIEQDIRRFEEKNPGIFVAGNIVGGISISDRVHFASQVAERIERHLKR
jgi:oxygen-dependent protoporphyrinogen oxidase